MADSSQENGTQGGNAQGDHPSDNNAQWATRPRTGQRPHRYRPAGQGQRKPLRMQQQVAWEQVGQVRQQAQAEQQPDTPQQPNTQEAPAAPIQTERLPPIYSDQGIIHHPGM